MNGMPFWVEAAAAVLLVLSGLFVLVGATGFLRLQDFFLRLHPPALAYTIGSAAATITIRRRPGKTSNTSSTR